MVRFLDEVLLQHVSTILGAKLSVEAMRDDENYTFSPLLLSGKKVVIPLSGNQVASFAVIESIGGDTKLVLSTVGDRKFFEQGQSSLKFLYWGALLAALLLGAFSWFFDRLVLKKLARLNADIKQIGESASTSNRVKYFSGNDEMSRLAQGINGMLLRLDK